MYNNGSYVSPRRSIAPTQAEIQLSAQMNVNPNPAKSNALIAWQVIDNSNTSINIYDIGGRLIKTLQVKEDKGQYNLNTSAMKPGLYFIRMISLKKNLCKN